MEFVDNSVPVREYDWTQWSSFTDDDLEAFLTSSSGNLQFKILHVSFSPKGGFVGGFLLGLRDRHKDNLMIKDNNIFFHLDFKVTAFLYFQAQALFSMRGT